MEPATSKRSLTIFHTNDFHNRLTKDKTARIAKLFANVSEPKLLLDAGDAGGSTNVTFRRSGEPVLEAMSNVGYSAMTVGNRDFHVFQTGFHAKLFRAKFPILCANIRPSRRKAPVPPGEFLPSPLAGAGSRTDPDVRSYVLLSLLPNSNIPDMDIPHTERAWKVLIVGFTVPMVTDRMWERYLSAYIFDPPLQVAAQIIPLLRQRFEPHLTIALTHIGLKMDRELAATVAGIDLIIGGHSHDLLPEGERIGDTLIVQAGSHARNIGIIDVVENAGKSQGLQLHARIEAL